MNFYKNITVWENRRRQHKLIEFRKLIVSYFNSLTHSPISGTNLEGDKSPQHRQNINLAISEIKDIILTSGTHAQIGWIPPRALGGRSQKVNFLDDLFYLDSFSIPAQNVTDMLERSIGVYAADERNATLRTYNPFWWIAKTISLIVRIPFRIIGAAGFDAGKAEASTLGRLFKTIVYLVTAAAALLSILDLIGWLDRLASLAGTGI